MSNELHQIRLNYAKFELLENNLENDPFTLFNMWLNFAIESKVQEPTAMILSTINENSFPNSRVVLLKGIENKKLIFYSNYNSNKAKDMEFNNRVSLLFFWPELERQVRVSGIVNKISDERSETYFYSRPLLSQVSATISPQSQVVPNRKFLEDLLSNAENNTPIRPTNWGGYEIDCVKWEFWQGRPNRLHDRILYTKENSEYKISRLAP